jgi:hypothetical protein
MRLTIAVHGHLCQTSTVGQEEVTFTLPDSEALRVRDVLQTINVFEEEVQTITVNGKKARLDTGLHGRVKVEFWPRERGRG